MFCARCGTEYREGVRECPDCAVPLEEEDSRVHWPGSGGDEPPPSEGRALVTVVETADPALLALVGSLLDDAGIRYLPRGEAIHGVLLPGLAGVQVDAADAARAKAILTELIESAEQASAGTSGEETDADETESGAHEEEWEARVRVEDDQQVREVRLQVSGEPGAAVQTAVRHALDELGMTSPVEITIRLSSRER